MVVPCDTHGAREDAAAPLNSLYFPGSAAPLPRGAEVSWGPAIPFLVATEWEVLFFPCQNVQNDGT